MSALVRKGNLVIGLVVLTLLLPIAAAAYTVVLRSGERRQIPNDFRVTGDGITYAVAPQVVVTIQMTVIDVRATEIANRERRGSLLARIQYDLAPVRTTYQEPPVPVQSRQQTDLGQRKIVTNLDLERYRRERVANETAFDQRQAQLGQPSLAEIRRRAADSDQRMVQGAQSTSANRAQDESYWRGRAITLRDEMLDVDSQIVAVRRQLHAVPIVSLRAPQVDVYGYPIYSGPNLGTNPVVDTYLQATLLDELRRLTQHRVLLRTRWFYLEEDARRAGAPAGWLRRY